MDVPTAGTAAKRLAWFPPAQWLREYRADFLRGDVIAGVTLAAYAIPVSLAYATLAGLPPQVGVYGYLLGGLGYALLGSSRQLAIHPGERPIAKMTVNMLTGIPSARMMMPL